MGLKKSGLGVEVPVSGVKGLKGVGWTPLLNG